MVGGTTSTSVSLSWHAATDNVGVIGYQVFRDGTQIAAPMGTACTDAGLVSGSYSYTVEPAVTASTAPVGLVVDDFDGTPAYSSAVQNDLGKGPVATGSALSLGGATKVFADYVLDGGGQPAITTALTDTRIPLATNGINRTAPTQFALGFRYGASGTVTIDSVGFPSRGPVCKLHSDIAAGEWRGTP
jgi:hypothetical protein